MSQGRPSPSGARLAGDEFQHLFTWLHALRLLRESDRITRIEFEVRDAGNVDDLVVHRSDAPALYHQIKFARDQSDPLTHEWFTTSRRASSETPLQRFHGSYQSLTQQGSPPEMALYTNRHVAAGDAILRHLDGVTDRLTPRLLTAPNGSESGAVRAAWAAHLGVPEEELVTVLDHLQIKAGRASLQELQESCGVLMEAVGLRGDPEAVELGCAAIRTLIIEGCRSLDAEAVRRIANEKGLLCDQRRATLCIQAIAPHPWPEAATVALDWVDLFEGDDPRERRRPHDGEAWEERMRPELQQAVAQIRAAGYTDVLLDGAFRLSTGMFAGAELADIAGFRVAIKTRDGLWTSTGGRNPVELSVSERGVGAGNDVAIGLSVSGDLTADALAYIEAQSLPVASFFNIAPTKGFGRDALAGPEEGLGWAHAVLDKVRQLTAGGTSMVHLFQFGPQGGAVLLGHLWNRIPSTQLYDDLGPGLGYTPTFQIRA